MSESSKDRTVFQSKSFESANDFDVFLSYEKSMKEKISRLSLLLQENLNIKVSLSVPDIEIPTVKENKKTMKNLRQSKSVICCMSKEYAQSSRCKDELIVAYSFSKPIIVILFDDIESNDLNSFKFLTNNFETAVSLFQFLKIKETWYDQFMIAISTSVEMVIGRKLKLSNFSVKDQMFESLIQNDYENVKNLISENELEKHSKQVYASDSIDSVVKSSTNKEDSKSERVFLNPNKLKLSHSNSLIQCAYGFNRIVWLECRERFLITSSYFKSIISIDKTGRWIEKRNPSGLMKCPFAICLDINNYIYVGDNKLKCIFVFNKFLKHLRTMCENLVKGFYDMIIDDKRKVLYATDLYNSIVVALDIEKNVIINTIDIGSPTFIGLISHSVIILSLNDVINVVNDKTFQLKFKFDINKGASISSLCTLREHNVIFLTSHEVLNENQKSKNVYLCIIKIDNKATFTRKIIMDIEQVNDMTFAKNSIVCINDTNVSVFSYSDIGVLIEWSGITRL